MNREILNNILYTQDWIPDDDEDTQEFLIKKVRELAQLLFNREQQLASLGKPLQDIDGLLQLFQIKTAQIRQDAMTEVAKAVHSI